MRGGLRDLGRILRTGENRPELGFWVWSGAGHSSRGISVQTSGASDCNLQKGVRHQGFTERVGIHPPSRSPGYSHSPLLPGHQAQPSNVAWPLAGPGLLQKGQCHPCLSENRRPEQAGFCKHHRGAGRGGAVSQVSPPVFSALLSALLLHSLSSFIPAEGTDFETSVSPSFISLC